MGKSTITTSQAKNLSDVDDVKRIADQHRAELGFHARQAYVDSLSKEELLIAKIGDQIVGFTRYHHRRDNRTTLYEIAVRPDARGKGIGHRLIDALIADCRRVSSRCLRLSCPVELPANRFYEAVGFIRSTRRSRRGRSRPLYEWELPILPDRKLTKALSDSALSRFLTMLKYKADRRGIPIAEADEFFASSKTCSNCGHKKAKLTLSNRQYHCSECGLDIDRDLNAAMNLCPV